MEKSWLSFVLVLLLALIHILGNKLKFLQSIPPSKWLSFAGGVAVAYVFIRILPELQQWQQLLNKFKKTPSFFENHLYLVALLGLVIFYGLEKAITNYRKRNKDVSEEEGTIAFWWHISSFAAYNVLIGYLMLQRNEEDTKGEILLATALGFHFFVNDYGLLNHHRKDYLKFGRWLMAGSVISGWLVGYLTIVPDTWLSVAFALLAGGIILNTLKEELPEERESDFWAFLTGAVIYAFLLIYS